jgi:protein gp37
MNIDKTGTLYRMASLGAQYGVADDICRFSKQVTMGFFLFVFFFGVMSLYAVSIVLCIAVLVQVPSSFDFLSTETFFGNVAIIGSFLILIVVGGCSLGYLFHRISTKIKSEKSKQPSFWAKWYKAKKGKYCTQLTFK